LWNHARTQARSVARDTAVLVAREGMPSAQAASSARAVLGAGLLTNATVEVSTIDGRVVVSISGEAPGILRGTTSDVSVRVALPLEGWVPL
jgi:hypothetical protein